jgi:two-component system sensor histidine kinase YesM
VKLRIWMPHRLKNRFIIAFLIVIIIPVSLFQLIYYWQIENRIEKNISMQNYGHLNVVKNDFETLKFEILRGLILIEQNQDAVSQLTNLKLLTTPEAQKSILDHMEKSFQTFKFYNNDMTIFLVDTLGKTLSVQNETNPSNGSTMELSQTCTQPDQWYFQSDSSRSLQLCSYLFDRTNKQIGTVYFILDVNVWLSTISKNLSLGQDYYMVDANGTVRAGTTSGYILNSELLSSEIKKLREGYFLDRSMSSVVNYMYLPSVDYYIVSQFHLKSIVGDLGAIQRNLWIMVGVLAIVFILITYFISSTITRPLIGLQNKMNHVARNNLKASVSEKDYTGEILELARSFNAMISDINLLVESLKKEERQRESFHYKMLLSQLNPHFLINALNLVKWNAIDKKDSTTHEICASLGTLLETSLNSEIDLIRLKNELDLIRAYLYIQQLRYKDRFTVSYEIEEQLLHALVPKFSLQPLVENAIIHGFARMKEGGIIQITAKSDETHMILEVTDNGQGFSTPPLRSSSIHKGGIGIANLKERLNLMFKQEAQLDIIEASPGTTIQLRFPLLISMPYNQEE